LIRHRPVDGFRHQFVISSLPEEHRTRHFGHIEGPGFVEKRGIGGKPLSTLPKTLTRCLQKRLTDLLI
jgi:hypothetical protein